MSELIFENVDTICHGNLIPDKRMVIRVSDLNLTIPLRPLGPVGLVGIMESLVSVPPGCGTDTPLQKSTNK